MLEIEVTGERGKRGTPIRRIHSINKDLTVKGVEEKAMNNWRKWGQRSKSSIPMPVYTSPKPPRQTLTDTERVNGPTSKHQPSLSVTHQNMRDPMVVQDALKLNGLRRVVRLLDFLSLPLFPRGLWNIYTSPHSSCHFLLVLLSPVVPHQLGLAGYQFGLAYQTSRLAFTAALSQPVLEVWVLQPLLAEPA